MSGEETGGQPPTPQYKQGDRMSGEDKISNKVQEAKGEVKERVGGATGDEDLQAEGAADKTKSNLKQAGEKVKDAFTS